MEEQKKEYYSLTEAQKEQIVAAVACDSREYMERLDEPIRIGASPLWLGIRRLIDIVVAGVALIVTFPINLAIAIVTLSDVGFPLFFRQERVGKDGKIFEIVKFRNMTNETDENGVLLPPEKRITKWGKFVRQTSLDELLNFWNILKGDMTLIGPRPLPEKYYHRYSRRHKQRQLVRPGLECPFHSGECSEQGWKRRFENDIWYVEHMGLKTDIHMMFLLVKKVFSKEERTRSACGGNSEFIGYDSNGNIVTSKNLDRRYIEQVLCRESKRNREMSGVSEDISTGKAAQALEEAAAMSSEASTCVTPVA